MINVETQNKLLNKACDYMTLGIRSQERNNFDKAKIDMHKGIDIIKKILITDNSSPKEMIIEYYSIFDKVLQNTIHDEE